MLSVLRGQSCQWVSPGLSAGLQGGAGSGMELHLCFLPQNCLQTCGLSLWSPGHSLQGEWHQVFVGYKDWPQVSVYVFYVTRASWWTILSPFTILARSHCCQSHTHCWLPGQWWGLSGARIWVSGTKSRERPWVTLAPLLRLCLMDAEATG